MKPFRITSLEAHQIGPFGDLKMTFPEKPAGMEDKAEVHILTGENGTGKSTVLEMLALAFGSSNNWLYNKNRNENSFVNTSFSNTNITYYLNSNSITYRGNSALYSMHGLLYNELKDGMFSTALFIYSGYRKLRQKEIQGITDIKEHPLSNSTHFHDSINPDVILQWIANNIAKTALAKQAGDEYSANKYDDSITSLQNIIGEIIEKEVVFILTYDPFDVLINVDNVQLDFNLLPDGLKSIISWLADLLMRMDRVKWVDDIPVFERTFILFLDEIEVHMHPRWQRKILPAVQGLFPNAQIFISTHSPFVINSVDGAWIHRLVKPNGDSVALEPVLSEDGKSINQVLEEIFDVTERFGVGVEADLKAFYQVRNKLIKNSSTHALDEEEIIHLAKKLQGQSTTLDQIVAMEIRQLNRLKQLEINV